MIDPFAFIPSHDPRPRPGPGLWFAFRGRTLLVGADAALPRGTLPAGLAPLRSQFLGSLDGVPCFSAELAADTEPPPGWEFTDLRRLYGRLAEPLRLVAARAVQVVEWDRGHQFCGGCGTPTDYHPSRHARVCPACRMEFFPRVSPAMIVAVEREQEILLARSPHFPPGIYSVLAGFVEPGESVEEAVHREVFEEAGVRVRNPRYFGSQAWPFPNSLMLGYQAEYDGGQVRPDPEEIEDVAFFHVDALPPLFPGTVSIAQWLMRDFLRRHGRELPE